MDNSLLLPQEMFMMDPNAILLQQQPPAPAPAPPAPPPASLLSNELLIKQLREIFPASIKSTGDEIKFLSRKAFRNHAAQAFQFIQFKLGNILSQYTEPTWTSDDDDDDDEKVQQRCRLYRLLNDSKSPNDETGKENISWALVDDKLKKLPVPFRQKKQKKSFRKWKKISTRITANNIIPTTTTIKEREDHADTRLGFRFANMFAVKRYFTFGERRTLPGEIHLIQTSDVPFLYNEVKPEYRHQFQNYWDTRPDVRNGRFDPADQKFFKTFVLNPDQFYVIPENTIYVLLTAQKTLFSLDRYDEEDFRQMIEKDFRWKQIVLLSPNQQDQELKEMMHVPTITTTTTTTSVTTPGKYKRKRKSSEFPSLDNETDWVYNDELKPPKIFIDQISSGGGGDIKFIPQYFYFEEPQQEEQDQLALQSEQPLEIFPPQSPSSTTTIQPIHENVEMILPPPQTIFENGEMIPSPSTTTTTTQPPIHEHIEYPPSSSPPVNYQHEDILFSTPSLWDELSFPTSTTTQQDEELQKQKFDEILKELGNFYENNQTMESVEQQQQPPPPVNDSPSSSSLDKLNCNNTLQQENLDEFNALFEEVNQYCLDNLLN